MQEVKFNYQGISISITDDKFEVRNKNLFTNTSEYTCVVSLERDGEPVAEATIETFATAWSNALTFTMTLLAELAETVLTSVTKRE